MTDLSSYDETVGVIDDVFRQSKEGMIDALSSIPLRIRSKLTSYGILDNLGDEIDTAWRNAILNFIEDLEYEGFDVSNINMDDLIYKLKVNYIEEFRNEIDTFFREWFSQGFEEAAAEQINDAVIESITGEVY